MERSGEKFSSSFAVVACQTGQRCECWACQLLRDSPIALFSWAAEPQ